MPRPRDERANFVRVLQSVSLRNPPFPCDFTWELNRAYHGYGQLILAVTVPDRDSGSMIVVCHRRPIRWLGQTPKSIVDEVKEFFEYVFVHELREAFHVEGIRVADPHRV